MSTLTVKSRLLVVTAAVAGVLVAVGGVGLFGVAQIAALVLDGAATASALEAQTKQLRSAVQMFTV